MSKTGDFFKTVGKKLLNILKLLGTKTINFFKNMSLKNILTLIVEALIFIFIIVAIHNCSQREIATLDHNLTAAQDRIETLVLENGNLLSEKKAYIVKEKQLEEVLEITKKEKKDIEKKLGEKIAYISNIESIVKTDTLILKDTVIVKDNGITIDWMYQDNWVDLKGSSEYIDSISSSKLHKLNINTPLRVGLTDNYTIFVETPNPYVKIMDIEGAVIDGSKLKPKPNYWTIGIQGGVGVQYGIVHRQFDVGPYVGFGVSYNFILKRRQ